MVFSCFYHNELIIASFLGSNKFEKKTLNLAIQYYMKIALNRWAVIFFWKSRCKWFSTFISKRSKNCCNVFRKTITSSLSRSRVLAIDFWEIIIITLIFLNNQPLFPFPVLGPTSLDGRCEEPQFRQYNSAFKGPVPVRSGGQYRRIFVWHGLGDVYHHSQQR